MNTDVSPTYVVAYNPVAAWPWKEHPCRSGDECSEPASSIDFYLTDTESPEFGYCAACSRRLDPELAEALEHLVYEQDIYMQHLHKPGPDGTTERILGYLDRCQRAAWTFQDPSFDRAAFLAAVIGEPLP